MNLADLNLVLRTRAAADTGAGGMFLAGSTAFVNAWNWGAVPEGTTFPYVVQDVAAMVADNAFALDVIECRVRFGIWHERHSTTDADPYLTVSNITKRIYGPWTAAGQSTAYGFHRFTPTFSGWTGTAMDFITTFDESDQDLLHHVMEFRFWISQ